MQKWVELIVIIVVATSLVLGYRSIFTRKDYEMPQPAQKATIHGVHCGMTVDDILYVIDFSPGEISATPLLRVDETKEIVRACGGIYPDGRIDGVFLSANDGTHANMIYGNYLELDGVRIQTFEDFRAQLRPNRPANRVEKVHVWRPGVNKGERLWGLRYDELGLTFVTDDSHKLRLAILSDGHELHRLEHGRETTDAAAFSRTLQTVKLPNT